MKKNLLFVFLFICCGKLLAQNIEGVVIDAVSKRPLKNAILEPEGFSEVFVTNSQGEFSFSAEGFPLLLKVSAPGYEEISLEISTSAEKINIELFPLFETLSEVVLRSTVIPQELLKTPVSISLLDQEDFQKTDETNIVQAFSTVPGLNVMQGALNTNKLSIRGVGARSQYSTNRVKAYFMEIPVSSGEGETTLDDLDASVIGRAEIIKGPVSSVYGAGLGGVINLYPVENTILGTNASAKTTFGSFGLLKNTLQANYASQDTWLSATYNHLASDGFRDNGGYERNSFTATGQLSGEKNNQLSFLGHFIRLKAFIPSSLNKDTFDKDPSAAAFTWAAAQGYESYDKGLFGISYRQAFSEDIYNTSSLYMNFRNGYEPRPFDILKEEQLAIGARTKFNYETSLFGRYSKMSFGAEIFQEWYNSATYENLYEDFPDHGSVAGINLSDNKQDRNYFNVFGQLNMSLFKKWILEAGLNYNSTGYKLNDLYNFDEIDQSGDYTFDAIFSPRLGLVYELSREKSLYASISHGFSTPTVAETLTPDGLINTGLRPETGVNYEVGFKGNFFDSHFYSEISLFSIQVKNLLVAERVGEDQYIGRNAGKTDHNGLEFLLNYRFVVSEGLRATAYVNGSLNAFKFDEFIDDAKDFSGNDLPAVPEKTINAGLDLKSEAGINFYALFQHQGKMALNDENSLYTESYELVNIKASYTHNFFEDLEMEVFAGVNNLFDTHYAASIVPNAVGFGGSQPRYFYPGNPKNYFAGFALKYLF